MFFTKGMTLSGRFHGLSQNKSSLIRQELLYLMKRMQPYQAGFTVFHEKIAALSGRFYCI